MINEDDFQRKWEFWDKVESLAHRQMSEVGEGHPDYEYFYAAFRQAFKELEKLYESRKSHSRYN